MDAGQNFDTQNKKKKKWKGGKDKPFISLCWSFPFYLHDIEEGNQKDTNCHTFFRKKK